MKAKLLLSIAITFLFGQILNLNAQKTVVVTGLNQPHFLVAKDNFLYVGNYEGSVPQRPVYKINITGTAPYSLPANGFFTGSAPIGMVIKNNDLYVSELKGNKISKIDLATGNKTDIITGLKAPFGLAFNGNDLYISEIAGNKVSKATITGSPPFTTTTVVTGLTDPTGIAFKGNDLYISESSIGNVSKIDITTASSTANTVITGLSDPFGLLFNGNDLYIAERRLGDVSKVDITNPAVKNVFQTGLSEPIGMMIYKGDFYVTEFGLGSVARFSLTTPCVANKPKVTLSGGAMLSINFVQGATYRWLEDCGNSNAPIANATTNTYTPTANGNYAIEVTRANNCKDTSLCTEVKGVGLIENTFASDIKLYPNPISDKVTIELGNNYSNVAVEITNILGQVITSEKVSTTNNKVVLPLAASVGIYFVRVAAKEGFASFKVIKE